MPANRAFSRWDSVDDRLWGRLQPAGECWQWTGPLSPKGYGQTVGHDGKRWRPYQLAYHLMIGPVPDGLVLDHLCRNRACANPYHLDPVPATVNTARGAEARWHEPCPNGHPPDYRRSLPSGKNVCVECRRDADRSRDEKNREGRRRAARERYARRGRTDGRSTA